MSDEKSQLRRYLLSKRKKNFNDKLIFSFEKLSYLINNKLKKKKKLLLDFIIQLILKRIF